MLAEVIIAGAAVAAVALRPRSWAAAGVAASLAAADLALAGDRVLGAALRAVWPMLALLVATISVSAVAVRLGAAGWTATWLARTSRGSATRLYVRLCVLCALLTGCLTLDGAVVLLAPVVVD